MVNYTKKIIINTIFNCRPFTNERFTEDWISKRMKIFMDYTLKSLKIQTNQDFISFIQYEPKSENMIKNELKKYEKLPKNIMFVTPEQFNKKVSHIIKDYDFLYLLRLDSDDMYHKTMIQQLHNIKPNKKIQAIINQNGYIYDSTNNIMGPFPKKSPNYYALVYKSKDYINGKRYELIKGHESVIKLPHVAITQPNYIRHAHSSNFLTKFERYHIKEKDIIRDENKIKEILKDFI